MKSLFEKEAQNEVLQRLEKLSPQSQAQWGKMNVAQMFAHCSATLEVATGKNNPPRETLGILLGWMFKSILYNDKPYRHGERTYKDYVVSDERDFDREKQRLLGLIKEFTKGGAEQCTRHPNPFFGRLTPEQIGKTQYKHFDHHFSQFGV